MLNYDPLTHSFDLPVQKLLVYCVTDRPLFLPPRQGSTPGTTLAGAFGNALWSAVCPYNDTPAGTCNLIQPHDPCCQAPTECVVPWLYKPYSTVHRRNFARPVLLRAAELEGDKPVDVFTLEVTLWGRHAIAALEAVTKTLNKMGQLGLNSEGTQVRFAITKIETAPCLTLAERIERLPPIQSVLLEFQTPFLHQEKTSEGKRYFHTRPQLPIVGILGNVAYNLVAWDIEDREFGEQLDNKARHSLARDARDVAWEVAEDLFIVRTHLSPVEIGERYSRGNQKTMSLQGFIGLAELAGNLKPALPWLLTLALAGGGQKRAMGFGTVQMWFTSFQ
ncbi:MAG: hypothetical protein DRR08_08440 [Candidatus Parabeggiatoa sp. nov. 2]|nr:MAG: hypothetical protein B6247_16910 [Beggiatoa sp. 4572_84]RKZ61576.1 MAG: hypothetical protein DRR08_08440 [Gammaproteobacteria bacterium]HEC83677.1 hypothetical protein [Thioploca sp.]